MIGEPSFRDGSIHLATTIELGWLYSTTYVINDAVNQSKLTSDTPVKTPLNNKKWNDFALNLCGEKQ